MYKKRVNRTLVLTLLALSSLAACSKSSSETQTEPKPAPTATASAPSGAVTLTTAELAPFQPPLPAIIESKDNPITEDKVVLGRALYFETRLSAGNDLSCNSCHLLAQGGVDGRKVSLGHKQQFGTRNSPTVYNAAGHFVQFWDGRAKTVEDQARGPITNPVEMAMESEAAAVAAIEKDPWYVEQFKKAFPGEEKPLNMDNLAKAIGAFERKLVTPSRWDKLLAGDAKALTDEEKNGFKTFVSVGCATCHLGTYVGGGIYQKVGLVEAWPNQADKGRFQVTNQGGDEMMFKVPSLRNIDKTAPYFHDASGATLEEAVRFMGKHQLGKSLGTAQVASIVTWLKTLSGDAPADYIAEFKVPATEAKAGSKK